MLLFKEYLGRSTTILLSALARSRAGKHRSLLAMAIVGGLVAVLLPFVPLAQAQPDFEGLVCLSGPYDSPQTPKEQRISILVEWLHSTLAPYPPLSELMEDDPPEICLAEQIFGAQAYYEPNEHRIVFRETLSPTFMGAVAIHELRHVHQAKLGVCPHPGLSMEATASVILAMEADASAVSLAIAWQLRARGQPETWDALAGWPSYSSLAQTFEAELLESNDIALATGAAFAAWYEIEWLADSYYVAACSAYLDRQDETHALPRYGSVEPDFLETLCTLPNGRPYPCDAHAARPERRR
jgi:hypothetical protein